MTARRQQPMASTSTAKVIINNIKPNCFSQSIIIHEGRAANSVTSRMAATSTAPVIINNNITPESLIIEGRTANSSRMTSTSTAPAIINNFYISY